MALVAASIALAMLAAALFGGVFADSDARGSKPARPDVSTLKGESVLGELGIARGAQSIERLEAAAEANPSARTFALLATAHLDDVTATGDPAGYARADAALKRALELDPKSYSALVTTATLAAARHLFPDALKHATAASLIQPESTEALAIKGDAELELGRYDEAFATFDEMNDRKPSFASYARASYGRELVGDRAGAIQAMTLAADVAPARSQPRAFALLNRGNLYLAAGKVAAAERDYDGALDAVADYPAALIGKSHIAFWAGDEAAAVRFAERASKVSGLPEHSMALTQILQAVGRMPELPRADRRVAETVRAERKVGALLDFELAVWKLDRGQDVAGALRDIEVTWETRKSVGVADAMAWALVKNDRCEEALPFSERSMRLGGVDGIKGFHRAEIERCLGNSASARTWYRRALKADPRFSVLHVARARAGAQLG